jgi:hypothetical protein
LDGANHLAAGAGKCSRRAPGKRPDQCRALASLGANQMYDELVCEMPLPVQARKEANLPANQMNPVVQEQPPAPIAMDIQAIMTVIRRREWRYEKSDQRWDLP